MAQPARRSETRKSRTSAPRRRISIVRILAAALVVFGAGWAILAVSAASLLRDSKPDLVLKLAPADARAKVRQAELAIAAAQGTKQSARDSRRIAERSAKSVREALQRDPTVVAAWRTLGLVESLQGRQAEASQLFRTAERLSRRDAVTQLWLIEENVRRDDIAGALRHYDIALRTSRSMVDLLLPKLVAAASDPAIARPLAGILRSEPPWAYHFYNNVAGGLPPSAAAALIARIPLKIRLEHGEALRRAIPFAVEKKDYDSAWRMYRLMSQAPAGQLVRNQDFEQPSAWPTFEWDYADDPDLRAEQATAPDPAQGTALRVSATGGAVGPVASQLLLLPPGEYRLSSVTERSDQPVPEWLRWQVSCNGASTMLLSKDSAPVRAGLNRVEALFRVPATGCRAQWIRLEVAAADGQPPAEAWIHQVSIRPAGQASGS